MVDFSQNEIGTNILRINATNFTCVASTVLSESTEYNKLEIRGPIEDFIHNADLSDRFWQKIGNSITELVINSSCLSEDEKVMQILGCFVCVKKLKINSPTPTIPLDFYLRNKEVEIIEINCGQVRSGVHLCVFESNNTSRDLYINPNFQNALKHCTSFKRILFPCRLPYNEASVIEVIAYLNFNYLHVDETLIDFNGFCSNTCCYIRKMEIEIVLLDEITKAIVKVIDIHVDYDNYLLPNDVICFFEHNICLSRSVKSVTFASDLDIYYKYCVECWECMIRSFPSVKCFKKHDLFRLNASTIILMSKYLPHLTDLRVLYRDTLAQWPLFKQLRCLSITLVLHQSKAEMLHLCQQCENLEELTIEFTVYSLPISEKIVEIISKSLVKLRILKLSFNLKIGRESFKLISDNLKQLEILSFGCNEDAQDLFELFETLTKLKLIKYSVNRNVVGKTFTREDYKSLRKEKLSDIHKENNLFSASDILPEEIWAKVFRNLDYNEQVICRRVCVLWRHILSTYPRFCRAIVLGNCILASDSNPFKTFVDTQLKYNLLSLEGPVTIYDRNINYFWNHLGRTVNEIYIGSQISCEMWLQLVGCGMTVTNLPCLESIIFRDSDKFFELLSNCFETIAPMLEKVKKLQFYISKQSVFVTNICPDMSKLEYAILPGECSEIIQYISGHCPNMYTLDINFHSGTISLKCASLFTQGVVHKGRPHLG